jgi:hypothetical protein
MKLYFSPGACSLSPHIVAREVGIPLELERVDGRTKKTASGRDFWEINPKGYVPALELDDGLSSATQIRSNGTRSGRPREGCVVSRRGRKAKRALFAAEPSARSAGRCTLTR